MKRSLLSPCRSATSLLVTAATAALAQSNSVSPPTGHQSEIFSTPAALRPPAVSEANGKVDYAGGTMNSAAGNNFSASVTLPVARQFGVQADALYSRISDLNFYGGAGHFFWRDPDIGLLGVTGGYLHRDGFDSINTFQAGVEGQVYCRQFTFGFFGGVGSIDYQFPAPFIDTNPTRFVGRVSADYYALENLRVGASFTTAFREKMGRGEVEYQTPINGLALTGAVAVGDHGYDDWLLGVRYYFGGKKTLRDRQRQDDPPGLMPQILQSLGLYGAEFDRQANAYAAAHPSSGGYSGGDYGVITIQYFNPGGGIMPPIPPTPISPANPSGGVPAP